jgi:hypothetical protein
LKCGHANGARINTAKNQRKKVIATGGTSLCNARPTIQLYDQKSGAAVSSRKGLAPENLDGVDESELTS